MRQLTQKVNFIENDYEEFKQIQIQKQKSEENTMKKFLILTIVALSFNIGCKKNNGDEELTAPLISEVVFTTQTSAEVHFESLGESRFETLFTPGDFLSDGRRARPRCRHDSGPRRGGYPDWAPLRPTGDGFLWRRIHSPGLHGSVQHQGGY